MKNKTLQEQYNLIKEGQGNKEVFLREAKRQFPKLIRNAATLEEATSKLKAKSIINENYVDLKPIGGFEPKAKESWENQFKNFISENEGMKNLYKQDDWKNLDNQIGTEVLKGIEFEAKKAPEKTIEEIKGIVSKNLNKDSLYYTKNTYAGIEGIGLKSMPSNEATGKHAASGYSEKLKTLVKESLMNEFIAEDEVEEDAGVNTAGDQISNFDMGDEERENFYADLDSVDEEEATNEITAEVEEEIEKENKGGKKKKVSVEAVLREIEKIGSRQAMEAKCSAIEEEIAKREAKMNMIDENEDMAELVDKKLMKELKKEIKVLEKAKKKMEAKLAKASK